MKKNSKDSSNQFVEGVGDIEIRRSRRARRISLSVRAGGKVRLTVPIRAAMRDALRFLESKKEWVAAARNRLEQRRGRLSEIPVLTSAEIAQAKVFLPQRLEEIAREHGFRYGRVTIRTMKSRWGSCSARCDISLNSHLVRLPEHLRDYIILHELCHTVHHNHGAAFHALLSHYTSGLHPILRKEMRGYRLQ